MKNGGSLTEIGAKQIQMHITCAEMDMSEFTQTRVSIIVSMAT